MMKLLLDQPFQHLTTTTTSTMKLLFKATTPTEDNIKSVTSCLMPSLLKLHRDGPRNSTRRTPCITAQVSNVDNAVKTWQLMQMQIYSRQLIRPHRCGTMRCQGQDTISIGQDGITIQGQNISPKSYGKLQPSLVVVSLEQLLFADTVM